MKRIDLSIIIVSFNTSSITIECLESIQKTVKNTSYEVIVVDNKSADDSVSKIKQFQKSFPNFHLIENSENYGFSKANNIGIKKSSGDYVLFLNSDTLVYEDTIDAMIKFMNDTPNCGASTCFVRMPNGMLDDASHRGFPTPWRAIAYFSHISKLLPKSKFFSGYNLTYLDITKTHEIEALAGAFMLVRRKAGDMVGWWDEDFFWYGEDLDFCYRLKKNGWKIYFVPQYEILHYKGVSGGIKKNSKHLSLASPETKKKAQEARFNAMRIFYNKHYKTKYPRLINNLVLLGIDLKQSLTKKT